MPIESPNSSLTVNFSTLVGDPADWTAELKLDNDYNKSHHGKDISTFEPGDDVYMKLFQSDRTITSSLNTTFGQISVVSTGTALTEEVEDEITFINTNAGSLTYEPVGAITSSWIGANHGTITVTGKEIQTVNNVPAGILKCTYNTLFDRLELKNTDIVGEDSYDILNVVNFTNDESVSLSVPFERTLGVDVELEIVVKDICSDLPVEDANVVVSYPSGTGSLVSGVTDKDGVLACGIVKSGDIFDLIITASGYENSIADNLKNDSFTVPIP